MRHLLGTTRAEYKIDSLSLEIDIDMIIADEYVGRLEVTSILPELPNQRHMQCSNSCLSAIDKQQGFLIYATPEGKTSEFSITKNNRMFEGVMRRTLVPSALLKDGNVSMVEPGRLCIACKYFARCYI